MKNNRRGSANLDIMIVVALISVGAAIAIPGLIKVLKPGPGSKDSWGGVVAGGALVALGVGSMIWWKVGAWLDRRRNQ